MHWFKILLDSFRAMVGKSWVNPLQNQINTNGHGFLFYINFKDIFNVQYCCDYSQRWRWILRSVVLNFLAKIGFGGLFTTTLKP